MGKAKIGKIATWFRVATTTVLGHEVTARYLPEAFDKVGYLASPKPQLTRSLHRFVQGKR